MSKLWWIGDAWDVEGYEVRLYRYDVGWCYRVGGGPSRRQVVTGWSKFYCTALHIAEVIVAHRLAGAPLPPGPSADLLA